MADPNLNQPEFWAIAGSFIENYGLPSFLVIYLLTSFQKKLDHLSRRVDIMTGVLLNLAKTDRSSLDE